MLTLAVYDIEQDRIRAKIADICKDYGLERIQFSAFMGRLSRNRREELFLKLTGRLGDTPGQILVVPICEKDARAVQEKTVPPAREAHGAEETSAP
ncbi:MAG: CRISPR-associated endonuclease Cas2 [Nitrospirae bacterium]|nr:CRISPR-associated endonuclease Cas2 [Nitrospirota bacterium]